MPKTPTNSASSLLDARAIGNQVISGVETLLHPAICQ
jgi:hypothetical protein